MSNPEQKFHFLGSYLYTLDSKDRLNIPSKFRRILPKEANDTIVITRGAENCLLLYPLSSWNEFKERYKYAFNSTQRDFRAFGLWMHRDTADVQLDKQGRIQIPKILLKYAKIKKEVKIIGYENRIELWDPKYLDEFIGVDENKYMQMAVDFTNPLPNEPTLPPTFTNPSPLSNVPSSLQINQSGGVQYNPGIPSNYPPPILIYHPGSYNQPPGYYPAYFQIPTIKPINNTGISSGTQEKPSSDASDPSTSIDKEKPKN